MCVTVSHFREDAPMTKTMKTSQALTKHQPVHLELPSPSDSIKAHPVFGNLNPFDILQHLLKQSNDLSEKQNSVIK